MENKSILYLECNAGISGDMMVAALLDLGADKDVLMDALKSIPVTGYKIEISKVKKGGVECCDFNVILDAEHENHDHDMEYLHGHQEEGHSHHHPDHHHPEHSDHHHSDHHHPEHSDHHHSDHHHPDHSDHHHSGHSHHHRTMREVREILGAVKMTEGARKIAGHIFEILARSEAKAHAVPVEEVHFHEVGAVDSIVDIISVGVCLDNLGMKEVVVPKLCEGTGTVRCQHGILPVPVPAAANIFSEYGINVEIINCAGEFVTPTGAAIVAAVCTKNKLPRTFSVKKIGMGAGKRNYERPSILRAMLIEDTEPAKADSIYKLESNIDDCTGENLGFVMERLFGAGARDVYYSPVYMKKNRAAYQINVICDETRVEEMENIIFRETTTIGIRKIKMERTVLERELKLIQTEFGEIQVKACFVDGQQRCYPEYESIAKACRDTGMSYQECYRRILQCIQKKI